MKPAKSYVRLIQFIAVLAILFGLPLLAIDRTIIQTAASHLAQVVTAKKHPQASSSRKPSLSARGSDWPTYLHDVQRTSSSDEAILSPSNVSQLTKLWSFKTNGSIAASAAIVNGTAYVGSWDGYEYALDAATGALQWKTYLGKTVVKKYCYPLSIGVTSSATVADNTVYVGGGDAYWYALDAKTGKVLWKVFTGDNSAESGHYNWSSPLLYNGFAYIGIASNCDRPLVQGSVLQVDLKAHKLVRTFKTVEDGQIGGGIWTSPSVDTTNNSLYFSSGTETSPDEKLAQAVFVLDASTLTLKSYWKLPEKDAIGDSDFDTSPILFTDAKGRRLVAAVNKNGFIYVFDRDNVGAGPVWRQEIDIAGMCPLCEQSSVSSNAIGQGMLFVAAGNTRINNGNYRGSVDALDPTTGKFLWRRGEPGSIIGAVVYTNGLLIYSAGRTIELLDARTGTRLYSYTTGKEIYAAPSVAHGLVFEGSGDGNLYAFGLPSSLSPNASDATCSKEWSCQDIGNPVIAGSESVADTSWKIAAGGIGIGGNSDQMHFVSRIAQGDVQISSEIVSQESTGIGGTPQIGLMVRQNNDASSPYYAAFLTPHSGVIVQYRFGFGGGTTKDVQLPTASAPLYLRIQRNGDQFQAATSKDGINYTLVAGSTTILVMPTTTNVGFAVSSNNVETITKAVYRSFTIGLPSASFNVPSSATPCPSGWICTDIGNPAVVGGQQLHDEAWTIQGGGTNIWWDRSDQLHYVSRSVTGDVSISTRLVSQNSKSSYIKAGIMIRQSTAPDSPYYAISIETNPNESVIIVDNRSDQGLLNNPIVVDKAAMPVYLKITRSGNVFNSYISTNNISWTLVAGSQATLNIGNKVQVGLAVTSKVNGVVNTVTFDHVTIR